jgi:hypothetical protein
MNQPPVYPQQPQQPIPGNAYPQQPPVYGYQQPVAPQPYRPAPQQPQYAYQMRRQSVKVHLLLLLLTGGIGNIFYVMWAKSKVAARWQG